MIVHTSQKEQALHPTQQNSVNPADITGNTFICLLVIICPILIVLGVVLYRQYHAIIRYQQIDTLEKLWRVRSKKENY